MVSSGPPTLEQIHRAIDCLRHLSTVFQARREQLAAAVGLTDHQWQVLEEISTEHFMPSMFARRRESSPAAVSKTIRQLVDKDLVSVAVSRGDARQRDYALTAKGKRIMSRLRKQREAAIEAVWRTLDAESITRFSAFSDELTRRLEQYARDSGPQKE